MTIRGCTWRGAYRGSAPQHGGNKAPQTDLYEEILERLGGLEGFQKGHGSLLRYLLAPYAEFPLSQDVLGHHREEFMFVRTYYGNMLVRMHVNALSALRTPDRT